MVLMRKVLSSSLARKMIEVAEQKAVDEGITIVISIYDGGGNLKCFHRMDNTSYGSIRISQLKAKTAASLPVSSRTLADRSHHMPANPYSAIPDILLLGGGLPIITRDKQHIGGIGISGATPELDELFAQAALEAVIDALD